MACDEMGDSHHTCAANQSNPRRVQAVKKTEGG